MEHIVISPVARGYMKLESADPFGNPVIDPSSCAFAARLSIIKATAFPGFLDNDFDMYAMRKALKRTRKFLETTPSLADFTIRRYGTQAPYGNTDAGTDEFIRDFTLVTPSYIFQEPR